MHTGCCTHSMDVGPLSLLSRWVALTFKNFQISVSLGRLRGVSVYVTGFVQRPGAFFQLGVGLAGLKSATGW